MLSVKHGVLGMYRPELNHMMNSEMYRRVLNV